MVYRHQKYRKNGVQTFSYQIIILEQNHINYDNVVIIVLIWMYMYVMMWQFWIIYLSIFLYNTKHKWHPQNKEVLGSILCIAFWDLPVVISGLLYRIISAIDTLLFNPV